MPSLVTPHDPFNAVTDSANSAELSPQAEGIVAAASNNLTAECGNPLAIQNCFDDEVDYVTSTAKMRFTVGSRNSLFNGVHHGIVLAVIIHHEATRLSCYLKL